MKKTLTMLATLAAMAMMQPLASQAGTPQDSEEPIHVLGEKLDSGLGTMVYGESLDSGLGTMVYGESLDSGLGELTAEDLQQYFAPRSVQTADAAR
jgi:hypothetical protein